MLNKIPRWLLICLPAALFWLGWPPNKLAVLLFFAFIPLFVLEEKSHDKKGRVFFAQIYVALFLWNLALTWWVWNSTHAGAVTMLILNTLFMCIPWILYRRLHKKLGGSAIYIFIVLWLVYEYLHHRWDLSWPWLTLGNGLAGTPWLVQWYDITGTLGGSAFVLGMNVLILQAIKRPSRMKVAAPLLFFLFIFLSSWINGLKYNIYQTNTGPEVEVVAMQPSFDPWNEKFVREPADLIHEMIEISKKQVDSNTDLLVWPETSLTGSIDVDYAQADAQVLMLEQFRNKYAKLNILAGADMQKIYRNSPKRPDGTARRTDEPGVWWNAYNSALFLSDKNKVSYYHKSILVPGTEQMPFVELFPIIDELAVRMDQNSISGSLGRSDSEVVFKDGKMRIAPAICYEGIYGDHVGKFVAKGANLMAIITNDAWWGNTPIYTQHLYYGRLRAIEHRKWIVRAANTGICCFIDPLGKIVQSTNKFEKTAIKQKMYLNDYRTIYTRLGDFWVLFILIVICSCVFVYRKYYKVGSK